MKGRKRGGPNQIIPALRSVNVTPTGLGAVARQPFISPGGAVTANRTVANLRRLTRRLWEACVCCVCVCVSALQLARQQTHTLTEQKAGICQECASHVRALGYKLARRLSHRPPTHLCP